MSEENFDFIELKTQQEIRQVEDQLVIAIQKALDEGQYPKESLEESQFRNLVRVANDTQSPEVVKNFLRYQVGRDKKWGRGDESLAEKIIRNIDNELKEYAETIAKTVKIQQHSHIWIELIRRYLGYGSRYLKYLKDGKKFN